MEELELYELIKKYAEEKQLMNTLKALPAACELLSGILRRSNEFDRDGVLNLTYFDHCLAATRVLIDINLPLSAKEEDLLLAATICHDIPGHVSLPQKGYELTSVYQMDPEIYDIIIRVTKPHVMLEESKPAFYRGIRDHKLSVLVALADRCDQVQNLHGVSIDEALDYVEEIRNYCMPMSYYALEHYPDVQRPITILMGKIKNLIDVTDIISRRYKERERAYRNELLSLMEENAWLRGMVNPSLQPEK